jgi:hypothetical protein
MTQIAHYVEYAMEQKYPPPNWIIVWSFEVNERNAMVEMMEICKNEVPGANLVILSAFISLKIGSLHC